MSAKSQKLPPLPLGPTFSPIHSARSAVPRNISPTMSINSMNLSDTDSDVSSFTEVIASKCGLEAELSAAIQVNNQLVEREKFLSRKIKELNMQADLTLKLLENKKNALIEENSQLQETLFTLPDLDILEDEYIKLSSLPIDDPTPLIEMGLLKPEDELEDLPKRLKEAFELIRLLEEESMYYDAYFDNETESELKHKIALLQSSSESNLEIAYTKLNDLKLEVEIMRRQLETFKTHQKPIVKKFQLDDIIPVLLTAHGIPENLKQIDETTFCYYPNGEKNSNGKENENKYVFKVDTEFIRPHVYVNGDRMTLFSYFKSIINQ